MGRKEHKILLPSAARTTEQIIDLPDSNADWISLHFNVTGVTDTPILTPLIEQFLESIDTWRDISGGAVIDFAPTGATTHSMLFGQATNVSEQFDQHVTRLILGKPLRLRIAVADTDECIYSLDGVIGFL